MFSISSAVLAEDESVFTAYEKALAEHKDAESELTRIFIKKPLAGYEGALARHKDAFKKYQECKKRIWGDVEDALGDELIDVISESLGPDATTSKNHWQSFWSRHCKQLFRAIASDDDAQIGRIVKKMAVPYIISCAKKRLETRARIKSEIDDVFPSLRGWK